jgi:hypothetical protein
VSIVDWLYYLFGFAIMLGAAAVLAWAFARQARGGKAGCGAGCGWCGRLGPPLQCDGTQEGATREGTAASDDRTD